MAKLTEEEKDFLLDMLLVKCDDFIEKYNAAGQGFRRPIRNRRQAIDIDEDIYNFYKILKKLDVIPKDNSYGL